MIVLKGVRMMETDKRTYEIELKNIKVKNVPKEIGEKWLSDSGNMEAIEIDYKDLDLEPISKYIDHINILTADYTENELINAFL